MMHVLAHAITTCLRFLSVSNSFSLVYFLQNFLITYFVHPVNFIHPPNPHFHGFWSLSTYLSRWPSFWCVQHYTPQHTLYCSLQLYTHIACDQFHFIHVGVFTGQFSFSLPTVSESISLHTHEFKIIARKWKPQLVQYRTITSAFSNVSSRTNGTHRSLHHCSSALWSAAEAWYTSAVFCSWQTNSQLLVM